MYILLWVQTLAAQPLADRNAIAAKYLEVMEKEALKKHVSLAKAQDRSVLAQKYLQQLKKVCCSVLQCVAACCSVLQSVAMCY